MEVSFTIKLNREFHNVWEILVGHCIKTCKRFNYKYAGIVDRKCFCDNSYGKYGTNHGNCQGKCRLEVKNVCGSSSSPSISIYATGGLNNNIITCCALFLMGGGGGGGGTP